MDHWIFSNPVYFRAWAYILWRANYKDTKVLFNDRLVPLDRGEFLTSYANFGEAVGMSVQTVRTFWGLLEKDEMIVRKSDKKSTKITVCNYDRYQEGPTNSQQTANKQPTTEKESKERKEVPLPYPSPRFRQTWEEWMDYRKSNNWPRTEVYLKRSLTKLKKLAGDDERVARKIVNQSMDNGWQGLFALKGSDRKPKHGKQFEDSDFRKKGYETIEMEIKHENK